MAGTFSRNKTYVTGETITASDRNSDQDWVITNADPDFIGDESDDVTAMQATTDPYPSGTESLATDLKGEIQRLRFAIGRVNGQIDNSGQWYHYPLFANICEGRITLASGTPVTTTDQANKTTVYFTPFKGSLVSLYDGTGWLIYNFSEVSIAVPSTTATVYDLFLYDNSGTLTLDATAWTNDTTRATALTTQNGVYVKTGATGRRYLGSFRTGDVSGQVDDTIAERHVWNYYNRFRRQMKVIETTNSWTYTTATFRQANANAGNQLDFIVGVNEDQVYATVFSVASNSSAGVRATVGIALDATNTNNADLAGTVEVAATGSPVAISRAIYNQHIAVGRHTLVWTEHSTATGTTTWYGDNGDATLIQSGIIGWFLG